MNDAFLINQLLIKHQAGFYPLVDFDADFEKFITLDFTANNNALTAELLENTPLFCNYMDSELSKESAKFGIGGYMEHRTVYARSKHFDGAAGEPRRLHLGVDVWGKALTSVYAFMDATVHSFAFNDNFGDYGATIILQHSLENTTFYSLYGHLSLQSLDGLSKGMFIKKGTKFCEFGITTENGHWPPHLHFQLMTNMEGREGDYPGVAKLSEKELWLSKIPDANLVLSFMQS
ncbi:MAG TPA: peptidoglycan DD-metalloendopeptidase family protein [Pelobium sp.]|nr:peptidoglycan DD-metalloendopeptidase family protein [Pelobium sp.]